MKNSLLKKLEKHLDGVSQADAIKIGSYRITAVAAAVRCGPVFTLILLGGCVGVGDYTVYDKVIFGCRSSSFLNAAAAVFVARGLV